MSPLVNVAETMIDRGFAGLRFVDGSSRIDPVLDDRRLITAPLLVEFTQIPYAARLVSHGGTWKFLLNEQHDTPQGPRGESFVLRAKEGAAEPTASALNAEAHAPIDIIGTVSDPAGAWQPRAFALSLARGQIEPVELFPTPAATRVTAGGSVVACLAWAADGNAVGYARATITVTVGPRQLKMIARADEHGDVIIPLTRLPPLDKGLPPYTGTLTIRARIPQPGDPVPAPMPKDSDLVDVHLRQPGSATTALTFPLTLVPGGTHRVASHQGQLRVLLSPPP
jgi:hypothetical protein